MIDRGAFLHGLGGLSIASNISLQFAAPTVSIGVVSPISGPDRAAGEALQNGVRAAIDDANRVRGAGDKLYTIRSFDDRNTVADALVNAQFATSDPTVIAVIGHLGTKGTIAAERTYAEALLPLLVPGVTDDKLTQSGYRSVFRLPTRDFDEGQLLGRCIAQQNKPKNAAIVVQSGDYGAGVANGIAAAFNAQKIGNFIQPFATDAPNFDAATTAILAKTPDQITFAGNAATLAPLLRTLRLRGYTGPCAATQGFFDALVTAQIPKEAEGITISSSMPNLRLVPSSYRIRSDYEARYGALAPIAAFAYSAVQIVVSAVRRSGAAGRLQLARALAIGGNFDTLVGSFTFGPTGDTVDPNVYFYTVRDGAFAYVKAAHPSGYISR